MLSAEYPGSTRAVGSLVVRASDSRPEGLDSMPDAIEYPPNTHVSLNQWVQKSCWRIFPSPPFPCLNYEDEDRWCRHLSCRSPTCLRLWQLSFDNNNTTYRSYNRISIEVNRISIEHILYNSANLDGVSQHSVQHIQKPVPESIPTLMPTPSTTGHMASFFGPRMNGIKSCDPTNRVFWLITVMAECDCAIFQRQLWPPGVQLPGNKMLALVMQLVRKRGDDFREHIRTYNTNRTVAVARGERCTKTKILERQRCVSNPMFVMEDVWSR
ncbi:hypothetical protein TNCV_955591 [Trichonephila clavipes]|nr:hypothetical protein TNCV_955591 [Trichonephila clavipes]